MDSEEKDFEEFSGEKTDNYRNIPMLESPVYKLAKIWYKLDPKTEKERNAYYQNKEVQKLALIEAILYHNKRAFSDQVTYTTIKELHKKGTILDYGCGTGVVSARLANDGFEVHVLDLSTYSLEFLKWRDKKYNLGINFIDEPSFRFDFNFADVIICKDVIEHLENPWDLVNDFNRILKKSGHLFLSWDNDDSYTEAFHPFHISRRPKEFYLKMIDAGFYSVINKVKVSQDYYEKFMFWAKS